MSATDGRVYTIHVCPDCGSGPETTPLIPGCGSRAIERGDNLRHCTECGFRGEYEPLEVITMAQWLACDFGATP